MDPSAASSHHFQNANGSPETLDGTLPAVHFHRRVFIGPLPERVVSQTEAHAHKHHHKRIFLGATRESSPDTQTDVSQVIKDHAFHFFVREGGKTEDWDAEQERSRTEELLQRWRNSEWGAIWHRRHQQRHGGLPGTTTSRWVGGSFEVGHLLGVNILDEPAAVEPTSHEEDLLLDIPEHPVDSETGRRDAFTISRHSSSTVPSQSHPEPVSVSPETAAGTSPSPTSGTGLLASPTAVVQSPSAEIRWPGILEPSTSQTSSGKLKGKGEKHVRYSEVLEVPGPAPPTEVLGRTSGTLDATTSAAASLQSSPGIPPQDLAWGGVVLRGVPSYVYLRQS